ncbi:MAG: tRNA (guanosine(37)-N1)-methyltransferase TrmD [Candidatus Aureabacteria bacterium]|nr:tRNA (guanosine(37)-N1)-methyltransferase TrmD [Candidatus Auribacterota bacterium]
MRFDILTLFPEIVKGPLGESIINKAVSEKIIEINVVNIRDFTDDKHKTADDRPFGGGPGMVMKPEPVFKAIESCKTSESKIIIMSPAGGQLTQEKAKEFVKSSKHFILVCGHYEGIDHRINEIYNPELVSIGPYVLTNGAIAAAVFVDVISRLKPGVLGNSDSLLDETHETDETEYPQYTRPRSFKGFDVPEVLLSGNHEEIEKWKNKNRRKFSTEDVNEHNKCD